MHWLKIVYYGMMILALLASIRGYHDRRYVLFIPLLFLSLAVEVARDLLDRDPHILDYFITVEYTLLAIIISNFIQSPTKKLIIRASIFVLVPAFIIIQLLLAHKSPSYRFLDLLLQAPFQCLWIGLYLFETVKGDEEFEITGNPMFWISLGNLLFFSGSFFSYGFGSYLISKKSYDMADTILWIARILNILLYLLYFVGFLCLKKKQSS